MVKAKEDIFTYVFFIEGRDYFNTTEVFFQDRVFLAPRKENMPSVQFYFWFLLIIINLVSSSELKPWEIYLNKGSVQRPLGLIVNKTSVSHQHFVVGYSCLHTFLYDSASEALDLALKIDPTFVEAHIGRLFG